MRILKISTSLVTGLALAAGVMFAAAPSIAAPDGKTWIKLDFDRVVKGARTDPDGVWKDSEIREDTKAGQSTLHSAHYKTDKGTYVVSVFYNDVCGMTECPIRVLFTPKGKTAGQIVTPTDYLVQACQSTDYYFIREDGSAIRGCGVVIDLSSNS